MRMARSEKCDIASFRIASGRSSSAGRLGTVVPLIRIRMDAIDGSGVFGSDKVLALFSRVFQNLVQLGLLILFARALWKFGIPVGNRNFIPLANTIVIGFGQIDFPLALSLIKGKG